MMFPNQVDMVEEYLHLCNGGVLIRFEMEERQRKFFQILADEKGMTLSGYISFVFPEALKLLEEEILA